MRDGGNRRDAALEPLRLVDADVGDGVVGQEAQRALLVVRLRHPGGVTELNRHPVLAQPLLGRQDRLAVVPPRPEPRRVLEENRPQLAGAIERQERLVEAAPHLVSHLRRQVLHVDVALLSQLSRQRFLQVPGERLHGGAVAGEERVGLDVERELVGRALDPELGVAGGRNRVVRRVNLDDRKALGVVAEARLRRPGSGRWIPATIDQSLIGP